MKLLISQKNELFDKIEANLLNPSQFSIKEEPSKITTKETATIVSFKESPYFFSFESGNDNKLPHFSIFSPAFNQYTFKTYPGDWNGQMTNFDQWLICLHREITQEDKWERLSQEIENINFKFDSDNLRFSILESEDIKSKIEIIKEKISNLDLLPDHIEIINNKIDNLKYPLKYLSKSSWKSLVVGTIITIIIQLSLSQETGKQLWKIIEETFTTLFLK
jgi:hypothetical protein